MKVSSVLCCASALYYVYASPTRRSAQHPFNGDVGALYDFQADPPSLDPQQVYYGSYPDATDLRLRIGNGGAGQSGLVGALANAYIDYVVGKGEEEPFTVGWFLGDTTQSLNYLAKGQIDVAITYNEAAEDQALSSGVADARVYAFRDHFWIVGPPSDPAGLADFANDALGAFNKLVTGGNAANTDPPVRFLSRFDKSATNIKESALFAAIGQVPWAYAYSTWYHQYPRFPQQALDAAGKLSEYTLTDKGTYLSSPPQVQQSVTAFLEGTDDADDPLLNPARLLLGTNANATNLAIAQGFLDWMCDPDGGQAVIETFEVGGEVLYSTAPSCDRTPPEYKLNKV